MEKIKQYLDKEGLQLFWNNIKKYYGTIVEKDGDIIEYPHQVQSSRYSEKSKYDLINIELNGNEEFKFELRNNTYLSLPLGYFNDTFATKTTVNSLNTLIDTNYNFLDKKIDTNVGNLAGKIQDNYDAIEEHNVVAKEYTDTVISKEIEDRNNAIIKHNSSIDAHPYIGELIFELTKKVNNLLDSDDKDLDQLSEIVAYIRSNKELIDAITTSKLNVTDVIDNLESAFDKKALSANQGVVLKGLITELNSAVSTKAENADLQEHILDNKRHITNNERELWNKGQANQNAFSNLIFGENLIAANKPEDSITLAADKNIGLNLNKDTNTLSFSLNKISLLDHNNNLTSLGNVNAGDVNQPVYFKNGVPTLTNVLQTNVYNKMIGYTVDAWDELYGKSRDSKLAIVKYINSRPYFIESVYDPILVFGQGMMTSFLSIAYATTPISKLHTFTVGGGTTNDDEPWYWKLKGTDTATYTLPTKSATLVSTDDVYLKTEVYTQEDVDNLIKDIIGDGREIINTWRPVKIQDSGGSDILSLGEGTSSGSLTLKAGDNIDIKSSNDGNITVSINLPTASSSTLGCVKIGSNINISNSVISVPKATTTNYGVVLPAGSTTDTEYALNNHKNCYHGVQINPDGKLVVNIPKVFTVVKEIPTITIGEKSKIVYTNTDTPSMTVKLNAGSKNSYTHLYVINNLNKTITITFNAENIVGPKSIASSSSSGISVDLYTSDDNKIIIEPLNT